MTPSHTHFLLISWTPLVPCLLFLKTHFFPWSLPFNHLHTTGIGLHLWQLLHITLLSAAVLFNSAERNATGMHPKLTQAQRRGRKETRGFFLTWITGDPPFGSSHTSLEWSSLWVNPHENGTAVHNHNLWKCILKVSFPLSLFNHSQPFSFIWDYLQK